jgi:hypothetical protein
VDETGLGLFAEGVQFPLGIGLGCFGEFIHGDFGDQ